MNKAIKTPQAATNIAVKNILAKHIKKKNTLSFSHASRKFSAISDMIFFIVPLVGVEPTRQLRQRV